jgi:tetratricopeptide (TPR) repeat protein
MGLNTGLVVVGGIGDNLRMDYTAVGDTTNLASRLQQVAAPGTILVSGATRRLVQGHFHLEALPPVQVKGKPEPVAIYKVLGAGSRRSPLAARDTQVSSQFVGRERERTRLEDLLEQVERGHGRVVGIVGEAGQGKSRLLDEFRQRLAGKRITYLEGRCLSYGSTMPYRPIMDVVRHHCGITDTDAPEAMYAKVCDALHEVGLDAETSAPYLCWLLGIKEGTAALAMLTPEAIKTRVFATLTQMCRRGSQQRPLICAIEDLHWIDNTSEEYLRSLVESLGDAAIMLLVTYRPDYRPPWIDKSDQISLRQLSAHDAFKIVQSHSQHTELPEPVVQMIVAKAEGNPFFLEELTRAVVTQADAPSAVTVPDTIQGVLMARIDRLPEEPKRLLQTASVLGREFSPRLLQAIWDGTGATEPLLAELKRQEFLSEPFGTEHPVYVFKHALTQEVAYASLLTTRRQALHAAAGRALEALYAHRLEDAYDRLAYHYAQTDEAVKAVEYLTSFAEQAMARYAQEEALTALHEAYRHATRLLGTARELHRLDLAIRQGRVLGALGRPREALDLLLPHQDDVERLQEPVRAANYYLHLSGLYNNLGQWQQALQHAHRCLEEASQCGDEAALGGAHYVLMKIVNFQGHPHQALVHGQQALPLLERTHEWSWLGEVHYWFAFIALRLGDFDRALQSAARTGALGETIGDRRLQSRGAMMELLTYVTKGEWDTALVAGQRALTLATGLQHTYWISASLGYAHLEQGEVDKAIALLEQAVQHYTETRSTWGWFAAWLGEAYAVAGRIDEARALVREGLARTREAEYWIGIGIAQRALGRVERGSGALSEAARHLQEALQTFAEHGYRPEQARTHLDLATVAHAQGSAAAAATHLRAAYALFTALRAPKYVERTEQLACAYAVTLAE